MTAAYTSLEHLKRAMNGGDLPVMTPPKEKALRLIDPAFVLGDGGLQEDARRGIRCPAKGCGVYTHSLAQHWHQRHRRTVGPISALREALGLKSNSPLVSSAAAARMREAAASRPARTLAAGMDYRTSKGDAVAKTRAENVFSMEYRNLRNKCDAQMAVRYSRVRDIVGRSVTVSDAKKYDGKLLEAAVTYYGGWNAFKATVGDRINKVGYTHDDIIESIRAWYAANGRLPSANETALPLLPSRATVLRVLGVRGWPSAMAHVAWVLGINGNSDLGAA